MRPLSTLLISTACAVAVLVALFAWDMQQGWWSLAIALIVVVAAVASRIHGSALQPVVILCAMVLFRTLQGWSNTTAAVLNVRAFGTYPHAYAAAGLTALLCLSWAASDQYQTLIGVRPGTAITVATTASWLSWVGGVEATTLTTIVIALPMLVFLPMFTRPKRLALLTYVVVEPILVAAVFWAGMPSLHRTLLRGVSEYVFVTAVLPAVVTLAVVAVSWKRDWRMAEGSGSELTS